ncbi:MAG TPA: FKBP-type peptidyl-prolyl cis-trans isomerase [Bacteroidales bacterium]|nr:FKBP-type peptidyl-prolyl cis-trans isomerase [Bacteroidales bacterium]HRZ49074.1 FKBP-type peptidyl-prolyl cis-trans isomerase [Bacteroidales bacterium]
MKKKLPIFVLAIVAGIMMQSCGMLKCPKKSARCGSKTEFATQMDTVSYMIGQEIGASFKTNFIDIKTAALIKGIEDAIQGNDSMFSAEVKDQVMTAFQFQLQQADFERREKVASANRQEETDFMTANRTKEGVMETESGIQYKVIRLGAGEKPVATDTVQVHYEGRFVDGEVFDASRNHGTEPTEFPLNRVIPGWTEALQLMPVGSVFEIYLPAGLSYGERGNERIQPNKMLIFKVELIGIKR